MRSPSLSLPVKAAILVVVFVVVTAIASLIGTKNLGTAATFGQVAFGITLVALILLSPRQGAPDADAVGPSTR
ncbi:MAG: hypothetical protein Q7T55_16085 [Solirubrobacteraceae bacterium]|nr:hypothetical protein [Solirubrobacteraceae bacterium]